MPWDYPDDALITLCDLCHAKAEFIKFIHRVGRIYLLKVDKMAVAEVSYIIEIVTKKLYDNFHAESAHRYMNDIKRMMSHG